MGKPMLSDMLAELLTPVTREMDPEMAEMEVNSIQADDGQLDHLLSSLPEVGGSQAGLRLRPDISLDDGVYRGRPVSRADLGLHPEAGAGSWDAAISSSGSESGSGGGSDSSLLGSEDDDEDSDQAGGEDEGGPRKKQRAMAGEGYKAGDWSDDGSDGLSEGVADDQDADGSEGDGPHEQRRRQSFRPHAAAVGRGGGGTDEVEELQRQYEEGAGDAGMLAGIAQRGQRERAKGLAVQHQQALYQRAVEWRILLQKAVSGANSLPLPDTTSFLLSVPLSASSKQPSPPQQQQSQGRQHAQGDGAAQPDPEILQGGHSQATHSLMRLAQAQRGLAAAAGQTLQQLMQVLSAVLDNAKEALDAAAPAGLTGAQGGGTSFPAASTPSPSSSVDLMWDSLCLHHARLQPFCDQALDRWHRRVQLLSGSAALKAPALRALNQSISSQVASLMRDPGKLLRRTQLVIAGGPGGGSGVRHLGSGRRAEPGQATQAPSLGSAEAEQTERGAVLEDVAGRGAGGGEATERDPETYDDSELYQQLLKEFLEFSAAGGAAGLSGPAGGAKKRKLVDRRASKGRKIRYNVQEKLVNFMAPVNIDPPPFTEQLFANLFAHSV
ncbi:apoptosis-antagonizing transcription factor [Haematococcus lacustris]